MKNLFVLISIMVFFFNTVAAREEYREESIDNDYSNEIKESYIQIVPTEGIIGFGNDARAGASETAVMAWFADLSACKGDVIV